jgi:hypothetical protein
MNRLLGCIAVNCFSKIGKSNEVDALAVQIGILKNEALKEAVSKVVLTAKDTEISQRAQRANN